MEEKCNFPAIAVPMVEIAESGIKCSRSKGRESRRTYASNTGRSSVSYMEIQADMYAIYLCCMQHRVRFLYEKEPER